MARQNPRRPDRPAWRLGTALALAVGGHLALGGLLVLLSHLQVKLPPRPAPPPPPSAVALRSLSSQDWAKNRQATGKGAKAPTPRAPEVEKKDPVPKGQVVDVAPGNNQQDPNAKYLAESSNRVKKETRAKEQTAFYRNAMPQRTATAPSQGGGADSEASLAGNQGLGEDERPKEGKAAPKAAMEIPDTAARQEVALRDPSLGDGPGVKVANRTEAESMQGNSKRLRLQAGETGGEESTSLGKRGLGIANLMPSAAVMDQIVGAAPNDRLSNVEEGEGTFLNTKEWKYASFFNRVKQSVGMHWNPTQPLRQRDPTGQIYGGKDRYTVLSVTLNDRGLVKDIFVEKSSGIDFLDREAMASFERAQPFPNPPPGLMKDDTSVQFTFGFFLELGGAPGMRLFRQAN